MRNGVQTVDRALELLLALAGDERELGVTELAARVRVHKSTASRLAGTLAARGFLARAPGSEAFRLGPELARLGLLALDGPDLVQLARPAMRRLAEDTGETINLTVLDEDGEAVAVAQVEGRHIVGVGSWTGRRSALHASASGKVLLAFGGASLPESLDSLTGCTIRSVPALRRELGRVRQQGFATTIGELEEGLHAVSAPILDGAGVCRGALSVSGPSYRLPVADLERLGERCKSAAGEIGSLLGGARAA